ncbi:hypothetical protein AGABI1DRAFT_24208, partial [Agaricus bisporus var. burnettii JB137-S8]
IAVVSTTVGAAPNNVCHVDSTPGVCISTADCSKLGGTSHSSTDLCADSAGSDCCVFVDADNDNEHVARACAPPRVNSATISLIKEFEGFVKSPSPDPIGLPTVGFGHLCKSKGCAEVPYKFPLTEANAGKLLQTDIKSFTKCVSDNIKDAVKLNANQFGALSSWAFNVGCGNVKASALVARLNRGEKPNTVAAEELPKWRLAGGKVLKGLVRRRAAEVKLFKTASSAIAHPPKCS